MTILETSPETVAWAFIEQIISSRQPLPWSVLETPTTYLAVLAGAAAAAGAVVGFGAAVGAGAVVGAAGAVVGAAGAVVGFGAAVGAAAAAGAGALVGAAGAAPLHALNSSAMTPSAEVSFAPSADRFITDSIPLLSP